MLRSMIRRIGNSHNTPTGLVIQNHVIRLSRDINFDPLSDNKIDPP